MRRLKRNSLPVLELGVLHYWRRWGKPRSCWVSSRELLRKELRFLPIPGFIELVLFLPLILSITRGIAAVTVSVIAPVALLVPTSSVIIISTVAALVLVLVPGSPVAAPSSLVAAAIPISTVARATHWLSLTPRRCRVTPAVM